MTSKEAAPHIREVQVRLGKALDAEPRPAPEIVGFALLDSVATMHARAAVEQGATPAEHTDQLQGLLQTFAHLYTLARQDAEAAVAAGLTATDCARCRRPWSACICGMDA